MSSFISFQSQFPYTFPLDFTAHEGFTVEDGSEAVQLYHQALVPWLAFQHPAFHLQLFSTAHFSPSAGGDFAEPGDFDIIVKSGEFEIRSPL